MRTLIVFVFALLLAVPALAAESSGQSFRVIAPDGHEMTDAELNHIAVLAQACNTYTRLVMPQSVTSADSSDVATKLAADTVRASCMRTILNTMESKVSTFK